MSDHLHGQVVLDELAPGHRELRRASAQELIALAIGVVHGCDGCIASHAKGAVGGYDAFCEFTEAGEPAVPAAAGV